MRKRKNIHVREFYNKIAGRRVRRENGARIGRIIWKVRGNLVASRENFKKYIYNIGYTLVKHGSLGLV